MTDLHNMFEFTTAAAKQPVWPRPSCVMPHSNPRTTRTRHLTTCHLSIFKHFFSVSAVLFVYTQARTRGYKKNPVSDALPLCRKAGQSGGSARVDDAAASIKALHTRSLHLAASSERLWLRYHSCRATDLPPTMRTTIFLLPAEIHRSSGVITLDDATLCASTHCGNRPPEPWRKLWGWWWR